MNRVTTAVAVMSLLATSMQAVAEDDRTAAANEQMQQTIERLELTDEQIEKVEPVLQESAARRQEILSSYGVDPEAGQDSAGKMNPRKMRAMRNEMNAVRDDTLSQLKEILSDEQLEEFKLMQEERQAEMRERMRGRR